MQHGNYTTAFFDVENRVLGLPMWKDKSKDVYDLLVGHEVGHALFTPRDFHHTSRNARLDYINLVEDVRIERKVQSQYPGLISCFTRGYSALKSEDFFGINHKNVDDLGFADRLNLAFKLRNLIAIKFSPAEQVIFNQIENAETWDEVVTAALDLEKFIKESRKQNTDKSKDGKDGEQTKQAQQPAPAEQNDSVGEPQIDPTANNSESNSDSDTTESKTDVQDDTNSAEDKSSSTDSMQSDSADASGETQSSDDESQDDSAAAQSDSTKSDQTSSTTTNSNGDSKQNAIAHDAVTTQQCFDENTRKHLVDNSKETLSTVFPVPPTLAECIENVLPFARLHALRMQPNSVYSVAASMPNLQADYQNFIKSTRKVVGMLAKEFELRKAAFSYSRATVSKTGSLNVNRLHAYKVSDDLFLSVTKLADAKNHGMVMFVDYSGSMQRQLPHVLKHLINMALFCRQVGIPFAVYGFTSDNNTANLVKSVSYYDIHAHALDKILVSNTILIELINSDLNKTQFNDAIYALYLRAHDNKFCAPCEILGNTPLNETIIIAHELIKKFRDKHNPDKMTAIFLTDGSGNPLRVSNSASLTSLRVDTLSHYYYTGRTQFKLNGRTVRANHYLMTSALIENLRITTNSEIIGFYIPGSSSLLRNHSAEALASVHGDSNSAGRALWSSKFERLYKNDQFISIPGAFNYSNYFIVASGDDLAVDDEELEVTADMSRGRIARAFMNYSSSKKANRIFVTKFAEAIS